MPIRYTYSCYFLNIIMKHSICFEFFQCSTSLMEIPDTLFAQMHKIQWIEFHNFHNFQKHRLCIHFQQEIFEKKNRKKKRENKIKSVRCFRLHSHKYIWNAYRIGENVGWNMCKYLSTDINSISKSRKEWIPFRKCRLFFFFFPFE